MKNSWASYLFPKEVLFAVFRKTVLFIIYIYYFFLFFIPLPIYVSYFLENITIH